MANKITVTSAGTVVNANVTPDSAMYYSNKSKEWAISDKLIDNEDYSSKYYANESKKQADISIAKTTEVIASGNTAVSNIESARDNALSAIGQTNGSGARGEAITAITNNKTSALTEISSKQNSAVSAISTQQTNAIKAVQNQQTSSVNTVKSTGQSYVDKCKAWASSPNVVEGGLYSAKYYAEMAQGKSDVTYETLRASRAYEDKGALLTDEQGFAEVAKYKHSTFDLSKFEVVGSPVITDDGVASGFSTSSYLKVLDNFNPQGSWEIINKIKAENYNHDSYFLGNFRADGGAGLTLGVNLMGQIKMWISSNGSSWNVVSGLTSSTKVILDNYYIIKNGFNGSEYYFEILKEDGTLLERKFVTSNDKIYGTKLLLGTSFNNDFYTRGSIDLKQFSITIDGKEVFSGNKTGIDVIKPDNYEVVGSPVINDDGVVSELNSSNKLTKSNISIGTKNKYIIPFRNLSENTASYSVNLVAFTDTRGRTLNFWSGTNTATSASVNMYYSGASLSSKYIDCKIDFTSHRNLDYIVEENNDTSIVNIEIYDADTKEKLYSTSADASAIADCLLQSPISLHLGYNNVAAFGLDLNAFKIYVDGNIVYQPCLKIPYTESKTGSKIVDVAYRDRVIDLYEQEGQARYFTIDEENQNFTLPMSEIYGMMGQRSLIFSTVTETNRVDIYSDKTCLICGNVATAGTINLPIELVNNNYFITLSTSAKTATSFTTTATGDYILIGKVI